MASAARDRQTLFSCGYSSAVLVGLCVVAALAWMRLFDARIVYALFAMAAISLFYDRLYYRRREKRVSKHDHVVLVDEHDAEIGTAEKWTAHIEGKLHRAFSVFLFNAKGEMLLQKRAHDKYHSADLWTNACCSHPRPGESVLAAARRRLREELNLDLDEVRELRELFAFTYRSQFPNGLTEHEYDHVLAGVIDVTPKPDPGEASAVKWVAPEELQYDVAEHPDAYTVWFKACLDRVLDARTA